MSPGGSPKIKYAPKPCSGLGTIGYATVVPPVFAKVFRALVSAVSGGSRWFGRRAVFAPSSIAALAASARLSEVDALLLGATASRVFPKVVSVYARYAKMSILTRHFAPYRFQSRYIAFAAGSKRSVKPSTSSMSYQPVFPRMNRAAVSAPLANALRLNDSCVSESRSFSLASRTVCTPT